VKRTRRVDGRGRLAGIQREVDIDGVIPPDESGGVRHGDVITVGCTSELGGHGTRHITDMERS
jgi:hypothetical protein